MKYVGKKILSILLVTAIVSTLLSGVPVSQVYGFTSGDWKYEIVGNEVTITGYVGEESKVTVPSTIDGKVVTAIGDIAFYICESVSDISIPNSVVSIDDRAFVYCNNLANINVDIDNKAFSSQSGVLYNKEKTKLIRYPEGRKENDFIIPNSVTSIGDKAFLYCTGIKNITIPNSVTYIGKYAFYTCLDLTTIIIPDSVTYIGERAFGVCQNLIGIRLSNSMTSISASTFSSCVSMKYILIPNSVASIGESAFECCYDLKNITIPTSVTSIGEEAFGYCHSLINITIPSSVVSIGRYAFSPCKNLKTVKFMGKMPMILDSNTFGDMRSETVILYPEKYADSWAYYKEYPKQSHNDVEIPVSTVTINKKNQTILKGKKYQLKYSTLPNNADDTSVKWSSSNKKVATVSQSGVVKAKGQGKCKITVVTKEGNKKASCNITVTLPISKIKLNKQKLTINKGKNYTLKVRIKPSNVKVKTVSWSSSNKKVATVSKGKVKAIRKGTCYITAKAKVGGKKGKCKISVK